MLKAIKAAVNTNELLLEEEQLLLKKNKADKLSKTKALMKKSSIDRTEEDCKIIADLLREVRFLEQYKDRSDFLEKLSKYMTLRKYDERTVIFRQGDIADAFYIIMSGSVAVYIDVPSELKHFTQMKEINKLGPGDAFGELALLYDSKRTASIVTDEPSELLFLEKNIFRTLLGMVASNHINVIMDFFSAHPIFSGLPNSDLVQLAGKAQTHRYPIDFILINQGDRSKNVYFVIEGTLKVMRKVLFRGKSLESALRSGGNEPDSDDPTPEDVKAKNFFSEVLELDTMEKGSILNDYALLHDIPSKYTAITVLPSKIITLSIEAMQNVLTSVHFDRYRRTLKDYPPDDELRYLYFFENRWKIFKNHIVNHTLFRRNARKYTCLLYTSPSPRDRQKSRMPSSA
eukprot:TRINITY_DN10636_c0_g1_i1.p1 TRINITY_DN10636_c0_g1~~TRINITY_DN10636_c0_g1_i1.p1  ORF type:complete len:401 (+),score=79.77 TRINITY_DN10636_c0_g1_i1:77-1279(+)